MSRQEVDVGNHKYLPTFKDEAVRQVVERGYPVKELAARPGVSSHSLYKWVKAVQKDPAEQRADELRVGLRRENQAALQRCPDTVGHCNRRDIGPVHSVSIARSLVRIE